MIYKLNIDKKKLLKSCIYSSVIHAVSNLKFPFFAAEQSWDGKNYSFQNRDSRGTISFENNVVIAVRNDYSKRLIDYNKSDGMKYFSSASESVKKIARDTVEYLYYQVEGKEIPVVTSGAWSEGDHMFSQDSIELFSQNGGKFIFELCQPLKILKENAIEDCEFKEKEVAIIDIIYNKLNSGEMIINTNELPLDFEYDSEGFNEFVITLKEMEVEVIR